MNDNLLKNLDPNIKNEDGNDLWSICENDNIDWKSLARDNHIDFNEMFEYDGILYCMGLMHQRLFNERQLLHDEGPDTIEDMKIMEFGRLKRLYRNTITIEKLKTNNIITQETD